MTTKLVTGKVRLSYPKLFKPSVGPSGGEPKYSVQLLIPKTDTDTVAKFAAAASEAMTAKFGNKVPAKLKLGDVPTDVEILRKCPLRDGDAEKRPEAKGCWFVNVSAKADRAPGIIDREKVEILDPNEIYAGVYARVALNAYCYDANGSKGLSFGLNSVQKLADGERIDGRTSAADDFSDDWEDDEAY